MIIIGISIYFWILYFIKIKLDKKQIITYNKLFLCETAQPKFLKIFEIKVAVN